MRVLFVFSTNVISFPQFRFSVVQPVSAILLAVNIGRDIDVRVAFLRWGNGCARVFFVCHFCVSTKRYFSLSDFSLMVCTRGVYFLSCISWGRLRRSWRSFVCQSSVPLALNPALVLRTVVWLAQLPLTIAKTDCEASVH